MSITTGMAAVINIVLHLSLITCIGFQAAIISTFISNLVLALYRYYDINKKYYRMPVNKKLLWLTCIVFITELCLYWSYNPILHILNVLLALLFAYFICGDIVMGLCKSLFKRRRKV